MTRVQRSLLFAMVLLGGGGSAALYTLKIKVKTPDERFREERDALRLFHFGQIHVEKGRLTSRTATFAFARDEHFGWALTEPTQWPAEDKAINAMLDRMAGIITDPTITENATPEDLTRSGLAHPGTHLKVKLKDGAEHSLFIGPRNKMVNKFPITDGHKKRIGLSETGFVWAMDRGLFEFRDKRVFPLNSDLVRRITIKKADESKPLILERREKQWVAQGPGLDGEVSGDPSAIKFLLLTLTNQMKVERFVDDAFNPSTSPERFGLDTPEYVVTLEATGIPTRTVRFSEHHETSADEGTLFAFVDGTTSVVAMRPGLLETLTEPPEHYRDRTLSRFAPASAQKLVVEIARQPKIELEKIGDNWRMTAPKAAVAKTWRVDAIVRPLARLRAERWKTDSVTRAQKVEWLLEPWSRRLVVEGEGGTILADVRIGNLADEEHFFVMMGGEMRVGLVEVSRLKALPDNVQDLLAN